MKTADIGFSWYINFLMLKQLKRLNWNWNRNHGCKSYLIEKVTLFHLIASKTPFTNMIFFTQSIFEKFHFSNCKLTFDQPKERESSFQNKPKVGWLVTVCNIKKLFVTFVKSDGRKFLAELSRGSMDLGKDWAASVPERWPASSDRRRVSEDHHIFCQFHAGEDLGVSMMS